VLVSFGGGEQLKWKPFNKPLPPTKAIPRSASFASSTMEDILNTDAMVSGSSLRHQVRPPRTNRNPGLCGW
jgi:hypothetical protein